MSSTSPLEQGLIISSVGKARLSREGQMAFDFPENQVASMAQERQVSKPEGRGGGGWIWSIPVPQEGWSGAEMSEHVSSQRDQPSSGKGYPVWAGGVEKPCLAQSVPEMLGGSILDALLHMYTSSRGVCSCLLCSLLAHSGERRDTCSQGEAGASEQLLALMLLLKSSPESPGKPAGLMDHGQRTLAG